MIVMSSSSSSQNISVNTDNSETVKVSESHASSGSGIGDASTSSTGSVIESSSFCEEKTLPSEEKFSDRQTFQTPSINHLVDAITCLPSVLSEITRNYLDVPFTFTADIRTDTTTIFFDSTDGVFVEWGDGKSDYYGSDYDGRSEYYRCKQISHNYPTNGEFIVRIHGDVTKIRFGNGCEILNISQWGCLRLIDGSSAFFGCKKLEVTATDILNLKDAIDLNSMFARCEKFNCDTSKWNVSNVKNASYMFEDCKSFSGDVSNWNVSNIQNMENMFYGCSVFNSDLSRWDVSKVKTMRKMFYYCGLFTSDLSRWDVSRVRDMYQMFLRCLEFTSDLSRWNIGNIRTMYQMFADCESFYCDLRGWDVSGVRNIKSMFQGCALSVETYVQEWYSGRIHDTKEYDSETCEREEDEDWDNVHRDDYTDDADEF